MSVDTTAIEPLIQQALINVLTTPLEQESTFLSSGVRVVDSASPVRFPVLEPFADDLGYVPENGLYPTTDTELSEVTAMPSTLQKFGKVVPLSYEALRQSAVNLTSTIQSALTGYMAHRVDQAMFGAGGDGTTTIKGIFAQSGVPTFPVGGALTVDKVREAWAVLLAKHVNLDNLRLFVTPGDLAGLLAQKDGSQRPLIQPDVTREATWRLFGVPVVVTSNLPNTTGGTVTGRALLADVTKLAVVRDIQQVVILKEALAMYGQIGLQASARFDLAVLQPESVLALTGIARS